MRDSYFGWKAVLVGFALAAGSAGSAQAQTGLTYVPITPCRAVDTRSTDPPALQNGVSRDFGIRSKCGIPSNGVAVTLNATAITPGSVGHLTIWAQGTTMPSTSNLNYLGPEAAIGNGAISNLGVSTPDLSVRAGGGNPHLVLDVTGYYK